MFIEFGEITRKLIEVGVPAAIVECECVDAGSFGEVDIFGVIAVRRLFDKHVMSENERPGRASLGQGLRRLREAFHRVEKE